MQRLFIIRHGQSTDNAQKIIGGQRDALLTEVGKHQAVMAGAAAKKMKIDLIVCSPLVRSRMTAEIIAEAIGYPPQRIEVMPGLTERSFGVLEGLPQGSGGTPEEVNATTGVESLVHLQGRAAQALRELTQRKTCKNILIVCHYWVGHMLIVTAAGLPAEAIYEHAPLQNGVIIELA